MNLEQIQNWALNGPNANRKEYLSAILQGAGLAAKAYGAYQMYNDKNKPQAITPGQIRGYLSPSQGIANQMQAGYGQMQSMGRGLMDPNSALNQQQQQMIREQSADQLAMQSLLNRRQAAAMGQASGITAAQNRAAQARMSQGAMQQAQQAFMQNRMQGIGVLGQSQGLLGSLGRFQQGIDENIAQAAVAQRQQQIGDYERKQDMLGSLFGGLGGGLMDYAGTLT